MKFTCKDCPNRYPSCHDKCEKYQREKAEWEAEKAAVKPDKDYNVYVGIRVGENKDRAAKNRSKMGRIKRR